MAVTEPPRVAMAPTRTAAIPAAMIAYSMAVAPRWLRSKRRSRRTIVARRMGIYPSASRPRLEQRHQMRNQRHVRRRHVVVPQPVRLHPSKLLPLQRGDRFLPTPADEQRHQPVKIRVVVAGECERRQTGLADVDAQFLFQFADQTPVSYTHLRAHETDSYLVCRLLL